MPAQYDLPAAFETGVEDVNKFNRVPFYLVNNEVKKFRQYDDFTKIFGDITWKPNQGDTMKGVTVQPTPIGNSLFYPARINTDPNKSVFEQLESTETCELYWHDTSPASSRFFLHGKTSVIINLIRSTRK